MATSLLASPAVGEVAWCSAQRSPATVARAQRAGLVDAGSIASIVARSDVIVSVCPPGSADEVAAAVAAAGFGGLYVDANAIAPSTTRSIGSRFDRYVDGGIVGPPATQRGTSRLFVCGDEAEWVAALFGAGALEPVVLDRPVGGASALKLAYAAWTKISSALLVAVNAYGRAEGVHEALWAEWERSQPEALRRSGDTAAVADKVWRWVAEMDEIAAAFAASDLPEGFGRAAAAVFERIASEA